MSSKQKKDNLLDLIPTRNNVIAFTVDEKGRVTLEIENKGLFNKIAQKLFKKPKISFIHLDEMGSFIWQLIDGKKDIAAIGIDVKEHFGENAEPLYDRLCQYFKILESYGFANLNK